MYDVSDTTKKNLERVIGLSYDEVRQLTLQQEIEIAEDRSGKKMMFSREKKRGTHGRGNPLLARRRFKTNEDLNQESRKLFGRREKQTSQ